MNRRRSRQAPSRARSHADDGARHRAGGTRASRGSGRLRLIGGRYRRRQLPIADSPGLRPTPDRVRETLFNWLAFELAGRRVLDLFAGTGALGLEALSRGAAEAVFVESTPVVARALSANIRTLGASGSVEERKAADYLSDRPSPFDVVFLDPPFRQSLVEPTCTDLVEKGWLAAGAWIYVESERELEWSPPAGWHLHREIRAGDSHGQLFTQAPGAM